jgi:CRP/FNR family transcriptional regulator, cyclic AMP receptor protein
MLVEREETRVMFARADQKLEGLRQLPLFSGCNRRQLEHIARATDEVRLREGTILMEEGEVGRECFVIADGEAVVSIDGEPVAQLGPGDIVGEMALVDQKPRSATVVAETPLRAVVMTRMEFAEVVDAAPTVGRKIMRTLAERLRDAQPRPVEAA